MKVAGAGVDVGPGYLAAPMGTREGQLSSDPRRREDVLCLPKGAKN